MLIHNDKSLLIPRTFQGTWPLVDRPLAVRQVLFALFPVAGLFVVPGSPPKKTRTRSRWGKQNSWKLVKPNIAETVTTTLWYTSKGSLEFAWISVFQGSMSLSTFCCRVFSTFLFVLINPILNSADAMGPNLPRWTNVTKKQHRRQVTVRPSTSPVMSRSPVFPGIPRGPRSHQKVQAVSRGVSCGGYWPSWTLWSWDQGGPTT